MQMSSHTRQFTTNDLYSSSMTRINGDRIATAWDRLKPRDTAQLARAFAQLAFLFAGPISHAVLPRQVIPNSIPVTISRVFKASRRKGRRITVEEARQIALRAMAITDALLAEDREREAEFLRSIAEAEEDSPR
jgi:hypothetical protein